MELRVPPKTHPLPYCPGRGLTEGVADVLANWQNIFRAINLATGIPCSRMSLMVVKVSSLAGTEDGEERTLPEMLVRIPVTSADEQKS
jgi:hypothetical protein